ncbi:hypothetical protein SEA_BRUSACORAM_53 [Mycobacterium phage Brusacoram]|uniref:Uncharacterized protein n=3 Tax=Fishburnevirus TaxID=1983734 RepID=A0A0K1Y6U0_9CAUD|nr:hypothetical protein SEA_BRUSACORAM_53 [Mycobacterium phage Brusacoram]YP_009964386.1 hypothetical protein I5J40_gp53 [Mycobacterium phage Atcoo]AKY02579.1 hypothetical protein SEA_BRUSACORAM_53 [Mycobacterium phage Brusacoram]ATW59182.1 hypothetical protein SEA_THESPIS_53 [Mycobacterium phage Thespis]QGJ88631.1 hypothetical protein SEA_ATCOO_53 [Mycobacterium phage Atcoo]
MTKALGISFGALFVGTVLVANWATSTFGFVPVGFGQTATAGTFAAGFALAARDVVQDQLGTATDVPLGDIHDHPHHRNHNPDRRNDE